MIVAATEIYSFISVIEMLNPANYYGVLGGDIDMSCKVFFVFAEEAVIWYKGKKF